MNTRRLILLFILSLYTYSQSLLGQNLLCEGDRFSADVFTEIDSIKGIKYGQNVGMFGSQEDLLLDLYLPGNDTLDVRPTVILAFGGGFIQGARGDMAELCRRFARKGYVAATIDYRLISALAFLSINDSAQAVNFLVRAFQDVKAAIRFLKANAVGSNDYGIDPNNIFVGGVSAGAIAAAHAVYLDSTDEVSDVFRTAMEANGGWEGNSNDINTVNSDVQGVINWSGALNNASWIDPSDPPLFTVHDDGDQEVPYGSAQLLVGVNTFLTFQGSLIMQARAEEAGIYVEGITVKNSSQHVSYFLESTTVDQDSVIDRTANFMQAIACGEIASVSNRSALEALPIGLYPNPTDQNLWVNFPKPDIALELAIYDIDGRLIQRYIRNSQEKLYLKLPPLTPGLYMLVPRTIKGKFIFSPQLFEIR